MSEVDYRDNTPPFVENFNNFTDINNHAVQIMNGDADIGEIRDQISPIANNGDVPEEIRKLAQLIVNNTNVARDPSRQTKMEFRRKYHDVLIEAIQVLKDILEDRFWTELDDRLDTPDMMLVHDIALDALDRYEIVIEKFLHEKRDRKNYVEDIDLINEILENVALKLMTMSEDQKGLEEDAYRDLRISHTRMLEETNISVESGEYQKLKYDLV